MNNQTTDKLAKILEIINYEDDHDEFITNFVILCTREALNRTLIKLPIEKRASLQNDIKDKEELQEIVESIQKYISLEEFNATVDQVSLEQYNDFISTITPTLSDEQLDALSQFLQT